MGGIGVYVGDAAASAIGHPVVDLADNRAGVWVQLAHLGAVVFLALHTPTQKQRIQRNGSSIDFMRPVDEEGWFNLGHVSAAERSLNGEESVGRLQHQSGSGVGGEVFDAVHLVAERALDGLLRCPVCFFFAVNERTNFPNSHTNRYRVLILLEDGTSSIIDRYSTST